MKRFDFSDHASAKQLLVLVLVIVLAIVTVLVLILVLWSGCDCWTFNHAPKHRYDAFQKLLA